MIKAIFYTRFHDTKGPHVLHQVPEGVIVPPTQPHPNQEPPLFSFSAISDLIIPRQEYCGRLISVCTNHYRVIGHPVCISDSRYVRKNFIFNLALVLHEDADFTAYMNVVRKLAAMFRNLEEQSLFLSKEEGGSAWAKKEDSGGNDDLEASTSLSGSGLLNSSGYGEGGKIAAICEMLLEDLNIYCECMIPIDESNTINLKLFPTRPPPAPVYAWHVPISNVQLSTLTTTASDLTLSRIIPFIDGVNGVAQIAELADTDPKLTRKAIEHLLYYNCILLLDIFQFGAIYAPTAEIGYFVDDVDAQDEALRYACVGQYRRLTDRETKATGSRDQWAWKGSEAGVDRARLVQLYTSMKQGLTLKNWCLEHQTLLAGIDVRRFVTFGIIKGFLYRVHKYVVASSVIGSNSMADAPRGRKGNDILAPDNLAYWRDSRRGSVAGSSNGGRELPLAKYLDGMHCVDEMCTVEQLGEKKVLETLKSAHGEIHVIHR
ncbi:nitrogen permease regulator 2 [Trichodelitschia bisporula]|uniref:Nitrogen permease regulator 2 n=1 Tax=Trichodelitschia bisporula TaxID=703511 RepID=A0A6G1I0H5_9PEZI|nr:nitrogen permease regulator 2 [Trichodelitschia bisporula]